MIKNKTTLILGAGTSMHLNYPSGNELVKTVIDYALKNGAPHRHFQRNLSNLGIKEPFIKEFGTSLLRSGRNSIDEFLQYRTEYAEVGKLAIAASLLHYEHLSSLFSPTAEKDWYKYLYSRLNSSFEEFDQNQISIITFNYDRSLEFFLFHALQNSYGKSDTEVAEKMSHIKIIHIHGLLGELPWVNPDHGIPYNVNASYTSDELKNRAKNIKIIHDQDVDSDPQLKEAHEEIMSAQKVIFLGFGYHPINMQRLGFKKDESLVNPNYNRVFGTTKGFTSLEKRAILSKYQYFLNNYKDYFHDCNILELLRAQITID